MKNRSATAQNPTPSAHASTVYFDGACPLCQREIAFYRKLAGSETIDWHDISTPVGDTGSDAGTEHVAPDLTRCDAQARFHVRDASGRLVSGGRAFALLWEALPAFRPLARLCRLPGVYWIMERLYVGFLKFRPWIQRRLA